MTTATLTYYKSGREWRWRLVARNTRIVAASSEGFSDKRGAKRNARATAKYLTALT